MASEIPYESLTNNNKFIYFNCAFSKTRSIQTRSHRTLATIPGAEGARREDLYVVNPRLVLTPSIVPMRSVLIMVGTLLLGGTFLPDMPNAAGYRIAGCRVGDMVASPSQQLAAEQNEYLPDLSRLPPMPALPGLPMRQYALPRPPQPDLRKYPP